MNTEVLFNSTVVPDPPHTLKVDFKGSRVVNISWKAGFYGNSAIKNYTVEISEDNQIFNDAVCRGSLSSSACVVSSSPTTASLLGLFPWTTYNIRVFATNKIGSSNNSPILNVTTDEEGMLLTLSFFLICTKRAMNKSHTFTTRTWQGIGPYTVVLENL